jgi:hypothetical protein
MVYVPPSQAIEGVVNMASSDTNTLVPSEERYRII